MTWIKSIIDTPAITLTYYFNCRIETTLPTSKLVSTKPPEPITMTSTGPVSATAPQVNYCQLTDISNYYLTISFVLCIDFGYLVRDERDHIVRRVSQFTNVPINKITIYRILVENQQQLYKHTQQPPALTCTDRKSLDHSFGDSSGWMPDYTGYKASVDVHFKCKDARMVFELVKKIKYEISLNKLHDHTGFHVIGWVLNRWHCLTSTTTATSTATITATTETSTL